MKYVLHFICTVGICLILAACGAPQASPPVIGQGSFYVFDHDLRIVCMTTRTYHSYWVPTCYQLATDDDLSVWEDRYLADR